VRKNIDEQKKKKEVLLSMSTGHKRRKSERGEGFRDSAAFGAANRVKRIIHEGYRRGGGRRVKGKVGKAKRKAAHYLAL